MPDKPRLSQDSSHQFIERVSASDPRNFRRGLQSQKIARLRSIFENKAIDLEGIEVWLARDLQRLLGYSEWRNFQNVIAKAKEACERVGASVDDHFVDVNKVIEKGKGAREEIRDIALTRYACYLIAQNGDPAKSPVAFAQTYFALQTRKQEVLEERLAERERLDAREKLSQTERELSGVIYERGVDDRGFAVIRSRGDAALFGGHSTLDMKHQLGVPASRALADFLPTVTIKAKDLAAEITNYTVKNTDIRGEAAIGNEHEANNRRVRGALVQSGINPENLPAEEDIKKVERRRKSEENRLSKNMPCFPKQGEPD